MRKVYAMQDLDCANCAAKMESAIANIEGVDSCTISFMTQKLTIECAQENLSAIMKKAVAACKKIEPDCVILV